MGMQQILGTGRLLFSQKNHHKSIASFLGLLFHLCVPSSAVAWRWPLQIIVLIRFLCFILNLADLHT